MAPSKVAVSPHMRAGGEHWRKYGHGPKKVGDWDENPQELFETWEAAARVHAAFPHATQVAWPLIEHWRRRPSIIIALAVL